MLLKFSWVTIKREAVEEVRREAFWRAVRCAGGRRGTPVSQGAVERALRLSKGTLTGIRCKGWRVLVVEARQRGLIQ